MIGKIKKLYNRFKTIHNQWEEEEVNIDLGIFYIQTNNITILLIILISCVVL